MGDVKRERAPYTVISAGPPRSRAFGREKFPENSGLHYKKPAEEETVSSLVSRLYWMP
jgi:hypothetical protein